MLRSICGMGRPALSMSKGAAFSRYICSMTASIGIANMSNRKKKRMSRVRRETTSTNGPSTQYKERIEVLDNVVRHCITVSRACAGIPSPTGAHFYASVLFTSLCSRAVTLAIVAPHSRWAKTVIEHWDYSSIAGIVRSILEVRLAFFYLCVEKCSQEEWHCRWNLFNLHDCTSRLQLFQEMPRGESQVKGFEKQAEELRARLMNNSFFTVLPEKLRNQLIKRRNAYLCSLEEIAVRASVDLQTFRWLYKLFSSQVHGLPMSFYRMDEQNRGCGVHSESEEFYTRLCLSSRPCCSPLRATK